MTRPALTVAMLAGTALPSVAQEFELDLPFDDAIFSDPVSVSDPTTGPAEAGTETEGSGDLVFDETSLEEDFAEPSASGGLTFELSLSHGRTFSPLGDSDRTAARLTVSDMRDLGALGILEWEAHVELEDPTGAANTEIKLDRIHIQNWAGQFSWKLGRFPIGWGEIEGTPVLDVLNAGLSLDSIGTATEDLPGQWFGTLDWFGEGMTLSGFVGFDPEVAHSAPALGRNGSLEFGLRKSMPIEQGQVSFYAARLMPQSGVLDFAGTGSSAEPYSLFGLSAHRAVDAWLLEADIAFKQGLQRTTATGFGRDDRIDAALGVEYALSNATQVAANIAAQKWMSPSAGFFDVGPGGALPSDRLAGTYQLSTSSTLANDALSLSFFAGGGLDGDTRFAAIQADYTISDAFSVNAGFSGLWAEPGSLLGPLDGTRSVSIGAVHNF